ncbi:MAG TPA: GrpB family protein [Anaerolineae bacterium]|nr:GrpB family protein [Anaerolineae bacterium]
MKVTIIEYSPAWPKLFEQEKILLQNMLEKTGVIIEHIGSTSVVGLAAKPIIDIMIGLPDFAIANKLVPKFIARGYNYISKYEDVMPERRFFIKKSHETNTHHIHMVQIGSEFWERHLLFRDFLRNNPDVAQAYASLKIDLAKCEWQDGNEYAEAKTEFIRNIEDQARKQSGSIGR